MHVTRHRAGDVDRDAYLAALNACFPGWGGPERFAWCFERVVADREPDLFLLHDNDSVIAGSAVTYRRITLPDGSILRTGIMTASWTLPSARGRGAFFRLIEESRQVSPELVAFVTAENASRRRLEAAGARAIPSFYCRKVTTLPPAREAAVRFTYTDAEWRAQFLDRPGTVEHLRGDSWDAVVQRADATDRLLHVSGDRSAAIAAIASRGRDLFAFTTGAPASSDHTPGFVMVFGVPGDVWEIHDGDRM